MPTVDVPVMTCAECGDPLADDPRERRVHPVDDSEDEHARPDAFFCASCAALEFDTIRAGDGRSARATFRPRC